MSAGLTTAADGRGRAKGSRYRTGTGNSFWWMVAPEVVAAWLAVSFFVFGIHEDVALTIHS